LGDRFLASPRVCPLPEHRLGRPRARILDSAGEYVTDLPNAAFTTPELVEIEQRLIHAAIAGFGVAGPIASADAVETVLAARPELSEEQVAMVQSVCRSTDGLRLVVGYPGAGKTFAAEAAVAAFRSSGVPVVGCAVTAEAADELACSTGLGVGPGTCDTLARFLLDLDHPQYGSLPPGTVAILDEASTVSHRELDTLVAHVARAGGALVLIGDPKQHGPVGPGHFFGWAVEHAGERVAVLRGNHRQRDVLDGEGTVVTSLAEERLANVEYREGRIAESLARRDTDGKVVRAGSAGELYDTMAADWYVEWCHGARDPMIAARNSVREELNRRARLLREAAGELTGPTVYRGGREFRVGDWVVTRHNQRRLRSADGSWYVKNGSRGIVADAAAETGALVVEFEGRAGLAHRVLLPAEYVAAGHVEWGYAVTDYGVQSRTLDRARAVLDDTTSAAGAYVATTRGRLENRIYIVDGEVREEPDPDLSHGPPNERPSSLEVIAEHLAGQQPEALLHEIDPWVARAGPLAAERSLAELHHSLARADEILAAAPADVSRRITGAERRYEELAARRRVVTDRLTSLADGSAAANGGSRRQTGDEHGRLRRELRAVDSELTVVVGRLAWLRRRDAERNAYRAAHAGAGEARGALRDAVAVREAKIRLAAPALLPPAFVEELSASAASARWSERHGRRQALERAALYRDRWGVAAEATETAPAPDATQGSAALGTGVLGPRPDDPNARREWDTAARAIDAAARGVADRSAAPDLAPDL
jgi:hypothetical protein